MCIARLDLRHLRRTPNVDRFWSQRTHKNTGANTVQVLRSDQLMSQKRFRDTSAARRKSVSYLPSLSSSTTVLDVLFVTLLSNRVVQVKTPMPTSPEEKRSWLKLCHASCAHLSCVSLRVQLRLLKKLLLQSLIKAKVDQTKNGTRRRAERVRKKTV